MGKSIYLGQANSVSADIQHLARVGRKIFVGLIAIFSAVLAKIKWFVGEIRKMIGAYDQRVFWTSHFMCTGLAIITIIVIGQDQGRTPDLISYLLFVNCFIFLLFYDFLQITKKDENGQSHWL